MIVAIADLDGTKIYPYGYANRWKKIKVDEDTLFEIASLSKSFTALAVLLLEQRQMISLEDKISQYISGLELCLEGENKNIADNITLKHLLYHTSGLRYETIELFAFAKKERISEMLLKLNSYHLRFLPGERFLYASINYDILAYVVEIMTGMSFSDFLENNIFDVLGMKNTYACREKAIATGKMSEGYKIQFGRSRKCKCYEHRTNIASGYIISNITDMILWAKLQNGLIEDIPDEFKIAIERCHIPDKTVKNHMNFYYGCGWHIHIRESRIMHMGNNPAFASCITLRPKKKHATCILMNTNSLATAEIAEDLFKDRMRVSENKYSVGMNYILDKLGSTICIINAILMLFFKPWNIIWRIIYALLSIILLFEYVYIKVKKRVSAKVMLEWVADSVKWSYLGYFVISFINILVILYENLLN